MNAYELAEGILAIEERIFLTKQEHKLFQNSANMLRQQADRIDRLEREAVARNNYLEQHCQKIDQQADRIAELEKGLELVKDAYCVMDSECRQLKAQTKSLSDEKIAKENLRKLNLALESQKLSDDEIDDVYFKLFGMNPADKYALEFARAIEERHGIK